MIEDFDIQAGGRGLSHEEIRGRYGRWMKVGPSVIVIGPDGVGKTTVVRRLSEQLNIPSFKCPSEKEIFRNGGRESLAFDYTLTHFLAQTGLRIVSDRGYPCEWVYSSVFNRDTDMELLSKIDDRHSFLGTRILYLYSSVPPYDDDDVVPRDRLSEIQDQYDEFVRQTGCHVTAIDTARMLIEWHEHDRDVSGEFAATAIGMMGIA